MFSEDQEARVTFVIQALIFDFDGLILDTEGPIFQSWQELYQAQGGYLPLSTWADFIGTAEKTFNLFDHLEQQLGHPLDRNMLGPRRRGREMELVAMQPVLPGVQAHIERARQLGLKLGLASSSDCGWVTGHLERLGLLPAFDCICAADDVQVTKPNPALYLSVLTGLNLRANQAIALEDSPNGVLAAKRAGIFCVAVPNQLTRRLPLDHADLLLASLEDISLDDLLARVEKTG